MEESPIERDTLVELLDTLPQHVALVDGAGRIVWVNETWREFSRRNGGTPRGTDEGANYLRVCGSSCGDGDGDAATASAGIREVIEGDRAEFAFEYPCHSPVEERWFTMSFRGIAGPRDGHFVVSHQNITERKLAELAVAELALRDGLTGLANRRRFDEFLDLEWRRARREGSEIALLLCDVDHFKRFNDEHGHLAGDDCLRRVGAALAGLGRRPGDLVARYGGEEFAMIVSNSSGKEARRLAEALRAAVAATESPDGQPSVTVSVGVATWRPTPGDGSTPPDLIALADERMYDAKKRGRDRVSWGLEAVTAAR